MEFICWSWSFPCEVQSPCSKESEITTNAGNSLNNTVQMSWRSPCSFWVNIWIDSTNQSINFQEWRTLNSIVLYHTTRCQLPISGTQELMLSCSVNLFCVHSVFCTTEKTAKYDNNTGKYGLSAIYQWYTVFSFWADSRIVVLSGGEWYHAPWHQPVTHNHPIHFS